MLRRTMASIGIACLALPVLAEDATETIGGWDVTIRTSEQDPQTICILTSPPADVRVQIVGHPKKVDNSLPGRIGMHVPDALSEEEKGTLKGVEFRAGDKTWTIDADWMKLGERGYISGTVEDAMEDLLEPVRASTTFEASVGGESYSVDVADVDEALDAFSNCLEKIGPRG